MVEYFSTILQEHFKKYSGASMDFPPKIWFNGITYAPGGHEKVSDSHHEAVLGYQCNNQRKHQKIWETAGREGQLSWSFMVGGETGLGVWEV